jgi:hypothetical protein
MAKLTTGAYKVRMDGIYTDIRFYSSAESVTDRDNGWFATFSEAKRDAHEQVSAIRDMYADAVRRIYKLRKSEVIN